MSIYGESFRMMVKHPALPVHDFTCDQPGLKLLQLIVGGMIEAIKVPELNAAGIDLFANEEGKIKELPPNLQVGEALLVGPLVFMSYTSDGDSATLSEEQVELVNRWLSSVKHAKCLL